MNDFNEFLDAAEVSPPSDVTENVTSNVHRDLNPSNFRVGGKVLLIHAVLSLVTLSICSQFGLRIFSVMDLMESFMRIAGHTYCMAFCGALYVGSTAFALSLLLSPEEVLAVRRNRVLQFLMLSGVSLAAFIFFGAEVLLVPALLWIGGAFFAWMASVEVGWSIRTIALRRFA